MTSLSFDDKARVKVQGLLFAYWVLRASCGSGEEPKGRSTGLMLILTEKIIWRRQRKQSD